jgi:hypothetical protein
MVYFTRLEKITLVVAAIIILYQLLIPPIIGLANNGDFWRVMKWGGIQYVAGKDEDHLFYFIDRTFAIRPGTRSRLISSEVLFAKIALLLNKVTSKSGFFDLRLLGLVHTIFFLFALLLVLIASKQINIPFRSVLAALLVFMFCDVGYIAYFNSFYTESASLIFLFIMFGSALFMLTRNPPSILNMVAFFIAGILFISAKHQNSVLGFLIGLFIYRLSFVWPRGLLKKVSIFLSVAFCAVSFLLFKSTPPFMKEAILYNNVFFEILKKSPSPKEDLRALGLRPEWIDLVGTHAFMPNVPINDKEFREKFFSRIGYFEIVKFYINRPERLIQLMKLGGRNCFIMRFPGYLGNFEKSAGFEPAAQSQAFALWSDFKGRFFPRSIWVIGLLFSLYLFAILTVRVRLPNTSYQLISEFHLLLVLLAIAQFFFCTVGGGEPELSKHLFLFDALVDIFVLGITLTILWLMTKLWRSFNLLPYHKLHPDNFLRKAEVQPIFLGIIGIGIVVLLTSLLADLIGIGGYPGFGKKQFIGTVLGTVLIIMGVILHRKYPRIS